MKKYLSLRKVLMSLCMGTAICGFNTAVYATNQQIDGNKVNKKNPFIKPPTILPNGAPQGLPRDEVQVMLPPVNTVAVDPNSPEEKEAKFEWTKMRIVGYVDNNVLLRVEDLNNNNNNNSGNSSNNSQPITIMATLDKKFFFNKNFYTLKKEKNYFIVYNKSNKPMHSMALDSSPARLIQNKSANGASTNQGANSAPGK